MNICALNFLVRKKGQSTYHNFVPQQILRPFPFPHLSMEWRSVRKMQTHKFSTKIKHTDVTFCFILFQNPVHIESILGQFSQYKGPSWLHFYVTWAQDDDNVYSATLLCACMCSYYVCRYTCRLLTSHRECDYTFALQRSTGISF